MKNGGKIAIACLVAVFVFFIVPSVAAETYYPMDQEEFDACVANSTSEDTIIVWPGEYTLTMGVPTNVSIMPNNDPTRYEYDLNILLNGSAVGDEVATIYVFGFDLANITIASGESALLGHVTLRLVDCRFNVAVAEGWVGIIDLGGRAEGDLLNLEVYSQTPGRGIWDMQYGEETSGDWGIMGTFGYAALGAYGFLTDLSGDGAAQVPAINIHTDNFTMAGCTLSDLNLTITNAAGDGTPGTASISWNYFLDGIIYGESMCTGFATGCFSNYWYDMQNGLGYDSRGVWTYVHHIDSNGDGVCDVYQYWDGGVDLLPNMYQTGTVGTFTILQSRYNTSYAQTPTWDSETGELDFTAYGHITVKSSEDLMLPFNVYINHAPVSLMVDIYATDKMIVLYDIPADSLVTIDFTLASEEEPNSPPNNDDEIPEIIPPPIPNIPDFIAKNSWIVWGLLLVVIAIVGAAAYNEAEKRGSSGWRTPGW